MLLLNKTYQIFKFCTALSQAPDITNFPHNKNKHPMSNAAYRYRVYIFIIRKIYKVRCLCAWSLLNTTWETFVLILEDFIRLEIGNQQILKAEKSAKSRVINDVVETNKQWIINICLIIFLTSNIKIMHLCITSFMLVFFVDRLGDVMKSSSDSTAVGPGVGL